MHARSLHCSLDLPHVSTLSLFMRAPRCNDQQTPPLDDRAPFAHPACRNRRPSARHRLRVRVRALLQPRSARPARQRFLGCSGLGPRPALPHEPPLAQPRRMRRRALTGLCCSASGRRSPAALLALLSLLRRAHTTGVGVHASSWNPAEPAAPAADALTPQEMSKRAEGAS